MKRHKALLIDLDGTLYHGRHMIEGADVFIRTLKDNHIPHLFVTNNSSRTPEAVAALLNSMGIQAETKEVCTSSQATAKYIAARTPNARVTILGEDGLRSALTQAGLEEVDQDPQYVVQGIDRNFSYHALASAMRWISEGAQFILTNPDLQLPSDDGVAPGAGTLAAAIEAGSGVKPIVIGKPSSHLMSYATDILGMMPEDVIVVGDNMRTDISAGAAAGCETILVLTGITTESSLQEDIRIAGVEPNVICKDLHDLLRHISDDMLGS
ncbi:TIGR01457 family HAD-type hydrolase [Paenibacillus crassostreae]|uniref:Acid sugar phosphatase n=1 Tax=Paenibacillus crassostreae TaxID=1763538 RepID=A0A167DS85_9BACL|nr:TIGR01457 family HAD-type hydrolase [Paenibacillus crassostreae]AOZ91118.1 HAD family hydrolase [Paenibacillus crassostreae]OAB74722.1 HAD family hydrolase [Paenibacillus crassostreae]